MEETTVQAVLLEVESHEKRDVQVAVFVEAVALVEEEFIGVASVYVAVLEVVRAVGTAVVERGICAADDRWTSSVQTSVICGRL